MKKDRSRGLKKGISLFVVFNLFLSILVVTPLAGYAALPSNIFLDDFTAGYSQGSAPANSNGWYANQLDSGGGLNGTVSTGTVQDDTTLSFGRTLKNNIGQNLSAFKELGWNYAITSAGVLEIRFNLYLGNDNNDLSYGSSTNKKYFYVALGDKNVTVYDRSTTKFGITSGDAGHYIPYIGSKDSGGNSSITYKEAAYPSAFDSNNSITPGTMYTFVGRIEGTVSGYKYFRMKWFAYGQPEPDNNSWYISKAVSGTGYNYNTLSINTLTSPGGTQMVGDIQVRQYASTADADKSINAYNDSRAITADILMNGGDIGNVTANLTLPTGPIGDNQSILSWSSSNPDIINPASGAVTRPSPGSPDQLVFLTAAFTNVNTAVFTKTFKVIVKAGITAPEQQEIDSIKDWITGHSFILDDNAVTEDLTIPDIGAYGSVYYGTNISSWASSDTEIIEDSTGIPGKVHRPASWQGDKTVTLTATITNPAVNNTTVISKTQAFTFKVLAQSGLVACEDFGNIIPGQSVDIQGADPSHGWAGGWYKDGTFTAPATDFIVYNSRYGNVMQFNSDAYRQLNASIDFDTDRDYYIQWNQFIDASAYGTTTPAVNDIITKVDFKNGTTSLFLAGLRTVVASGKQDHALYAFTKIGGSFDYDNYKTSFIPGMMYTILMKIEARSAGTDDVYIKVYPSGSQEPKDWTYGIETKSVSGSANVIDLYGSAPNSLTGIIQMGNLTIEGYNIEDILPITTAENSLSSVLNDTDEAQRTGDIAVFTMNLAQVSEGIVKNSLKNRLNLIAPYIDTPVFTDNAGSLLYTLPASGPITCNMHIKNSSAIFQSVPVTLLAVLYDTASGQIVSVQPASAQNVTVDANESIPLSVTFDPSLINVFDSYNGCHLKVFAWNGIDEMVPLSQSILFDNYGVR